MLCIPKEIRHMFVKKRHDNKTLAETVKWQPRFFEHLGPRPFYWVGFGIKIDLPIFAVVTLMKKDTVISYVYLSPDF